MVLSNESDSSASRYLGQVLQLDLRLGIKRPVRYRVQSTKRSFGGFIGRSIPVLFFVGVNLRFVGASLAPLIGLQTKVLLMCIMALCGFVYSAYL